MTIQIKASKQHCLALLLRCTNWFQSLILETKSYGVSIHIRALKRHFPVGLLIMLHEVVDTIQMKATEQYFAVVPFSYTRWFSL